MAKEKILTNKEFAGTKEFTNACEKVGAVPTVRQASKFRNKRGSVYCLFSLMNKGRTLVEAKQNIAASNLKKSRENYPHKKLTV